VFLQTAVQNVHTVQSTCFFWDPHYIRSQTLLFSTVFVSGVARVYHAPWGKKYSWAPLQQNLQSLN